MYPRVAMSAPSEPASSAADVRELIVEVRGDGSLVRAVGFRADGTTDASVAKARHLRELLPGPAYRQSIASIGRVLETSGVEHSEHRIELDGAARHVSCRTIALGDDRVLRVATDVTPERRQDVALRASEARFRHVVEHAADGVFLFDENERVVMANRAACASLLYEQDELLGLSLQDIVRDGPARRVFRRFQQSGEDGPIFIEGEHVRRDGGTLNVEVHVRRFEFEGRAHVLAFARDVTERMRVQDALRRSEATMRSLVEHAPAVIAVSDLDGRARFVSGELPGWRPSQLVGKRLSSVLAPGHAEELDAALERIRARGRPEDVEVCMPHPDGEEVWLNIRIARVGPSARPQALIHIVQDVTEGRRTREALRASEARFRQLVDQAVDGIYVFDAEGRIVDVNARACESLGRDRDELIGRTIAYPSPELDETELLARCQQLPPRASVTFETTHARRDGRSFPVELRIGRMVGGGPPRFLALVRDISDRQNLERAALDAVEREQRRFGRDLHDGLGQHLAGIAFLAKALEGTLTSQGRPEAAGATEIARRVREAIVQTRALAHGLAPVGVHGNELVAALEALASDTSRVFGVDCRVEANVDISGLDDGTATALYRIAQEAVTNALRHADAGGIRISLRVSAQGASLHIHDDGCGIAPASQRLGGLGLQIMALRARRIGGRLDVRAGRTVGTTVSCVVPHRAVQGVRGVDAADPL